VNAWDVDDDGHADMGIAQDAGGDDEGDDGTLF
jgi:hypothetical protein